MDIGSMTFTILDVETTGLSPAMGDRVCEIGAVKLKGGAMSGTFHSMVDPQRPISPAASAKNGITPEMLKGAPAFSAIAKDIHAFMSGTVFVAQNAQFDLDFINSEFRRAAFPEWNGYVIDTISLARRAIPGLSSYNLDILARTFGVTFTSRHRSMGDVEATAEIFLKCVGRLKETGAARTLEELIVIGKPWRRPRR
ncbi:MAG: hypothetical protein A2Z34_10560 [Planctomycetes bacterium RBG_16_59_8]|nr:MAG: hypothetical protein A2Z34_10560 [Planctomycetes bacterium RBG_16_59_8]